MDNWPLDLVPSPSLREESLKNVDLESARKREYIAKTQVEPATYTAIPMTPRLSITAYQNRRLVITVSGATDSSDFGRTFVSI